MAGESHDFLRRLKQAVLDWAAWKIYDTGASAAHRVREFVRDVKNGGRHIYDGKLFRSVRALNAYHLARDGGYWAGDKARKMARKMGKPADAARRHARGWREAGGLIDHMGHRTARGRTRPVPERGTVLTGGHLRDLHRHHRDHERAAKSDRKAEARDARAARHEAAGNTRRAGWHQRRAESHRASAQERHDRWPARAPQAAPSRTPEPHPAGARLAPEPNGTRAAPDRSPNGHARAAEPSRTPGNGGRPAPERTGRTRT